MSIYNLPFIGRKMLKLIVKKEKGEMFSSTLRSYVKEKYNVDVGMYTNGLWYNPEFNVGGNVKIGRYSGITKGTRYFAGNHPINSVSTNALFYNKIFGLDVKDIQRSSLLIGNDVWIGSNVQILSGCNRIGNGSIIGAGAIVTKDVPPYSIVGGVPAKIIRMRFDDNTIKALEESKWWELEPNEIMKYYEFFEKPFEFANQIIKNRKNDM